MSDEDAPAARGGFGDRPRRHVDRDDDRHRSWRKSDFPSESAPRAATPAQAPQMTRSTFSKSRPQTKDDVIDLSAYLSHLLDSHGVKPAKVLKQAGLRHATDADWHTSDTVNALYVASHRIMPQTLHTGSEGASDNDDSDERPSLVDSDSDN